MSNNRTIIINEDGSCHEFGVDEGQSAPFVIGLDLDAKIVLIHYKSTPYWAGIGTTETAQASLHVVSFDSHDIGARISTDKDSIFLRDTRTLSEFPTSRATAIKNTVPKISDIIKNAKG